MASDRQQFHRAQTKWEQLAEDGYLSVPREMGTTAIISSAFTDEEPGTTAGIIELTSFRNEARHLANRVHVTGGVVELAIDATSNDIDRLIQDPHVANMYVIGNGSLSSLILDVHERYDWVAISEATTHLKQGSFIQRQCGNFSRNLNVPLGLFALSDARNLQAAVGEQFYPLSLDDAENRKIHEVFAVPGVDYASIKELPATETIDSKELIEIARNQPKVAVEYNESTEHIKFRGNFYKRFLELKAVREGTAQESALIYVSMVKERFGVDLLDFYDKNQELCESICASLEAKEAYDKLVIGHNRLKALEEKGSIPGGTADELNAATGHSLGIEAIGIYHWNQINPLLEEAYRLLESITLNAPFLTR